MSKTVAGVGGSYIVRDGSGRELAAGDVVKTFRGEAAQLLSVAAAAFPGKSAKVTTTLGTHYAQVYNVTVEPLTGHADDHELPGEQIGQYFVPVDPGALGDDASCCQ